MLPSQILLNNLLYDTSQMAIPTDLVDPELVARPSHWDIKFIRRFMLTFGPISSIFDFATFAIMLGPFAPGPALFRSGWFVESLATQTLVVFVIRTRYRSGAAALARAAPHRRHHGREHRHHPAHVASQHPPRVRSPARDVLRRSGGHGHYLSRPR